MFDQFAEQFRDRYKNLVLLMSNEKLPMKFFEGVRSFKRSAELFSHGREFDIKTGLWRVVDKSKIVSNAKAGQSPHNWGLAADFVLTGDKPWNTDEESMRVWKRFGELAFQVGLEWGGNWKFRDLPHVQVFRWEQFRPNNWLTIVQKEMG